MKAMTGFLNAYFVYFSPPTDSLCHYYNPSLLQF